MASITVPTERSAHYGLRPPPAGSPTSMGVVPLQPADSVFVQARQAQLAQQAAMSQQQQQVGRRLWRKIHGRGFMIIGPRHGGPSSSLPSIGATCESGEWASVGQLERNRCQASSTMLPVRLCRLWSRSWQPLV